MKLFLLALYTISLQSMHVIYEQDIVDLYHAIQQGSTLAIDLLKKNKLLANANFASLCKKQTDTSGTNETPLLCSIRSGNYPVAIFLELLDCGADVNTPSSSGMTPLLKAITVKQFNSATALLEKNANTYTRIMINKNKSYDALELANEHLKMLVPLIENKRAKAVSATTPGG